MRDIRHYRPDKRRCGEIHGLRLLTYDYYTLVAEREEDFWVISLSVCAPQDTFSKKKGVGTALRRIQVFRDETYVPAVHDGNICILLPPYFEHRPEAETDMFRIVLDYMWGKGWYTYLPNGVTTRFVRVKVPELVVDPEQENRT